jgi:hypothetical protein
MQLRGGRERPAVDDPDNAQGFDEETGVEFHEGPMQQEKLADADFFNAFEDDFDEEDMS